MPMDQRKKEFIKGAKRTIPMIIGALPFGMLFGVLAQKSSLSFAYVLAMSAAVFAGASQLIVLGVLLSNGTVLLAVLTTFIVNIRHVIYAATLSPYLKRHPFPLKALIAFFITDETFLVSILRYQEKDPSHYKHWFQLGSSLTLYIFWIIATLLGLILHQFLPIIESAGLEFAMPAAFIAMIFFYLNNLPTVLAAVTSGIIATLLSSLPHQMGLIIAIVLGVLVGAGSSIMQKTIRRT